MTDRRGKTDAESGWLLLIYRVPPEPTRLRSTVWRRIESLGAIYLQNSVAALPASPAAERSLRKLRREILDMSGTALLLSSAVLAGEPEVRRGVASRPCGGGCAVGHGRGWRSIAASRGAITSAA